MPDIDWTKPIETTLGSPCVFLSQRADHRRWVAIACHQGWEVAVVQDDGYVHCRVFRIRNVPEKRRLEGWCNVWEDGMCMYKTRADADLLIPSHRTRIACVYIDQPYVVGEGLDE
jgi:hypothetical protein